MICPGYQESPRFRDDARRRFASTLTRTAQMILYRDQRITASLFIGGHVKWDVMFPGNDILDDQHSLGVISGNEVSLGADMQLSHTRHFAIATPGVLSM